MRPIDNVLDAFYRTTGRKPTGRGPYNVACPLHGDRHRSAVVTEDTDGSVGLYCYVCGKAQTEEIVRAIGLEYADLYEEQTRRSGQGLDGKSGLGDIDMGLEHSVDGLDASSKKLFSDLKDWSQTLPAGPKRAGWEQVLKEEEFRSLIGIVKDRFNKRPKKEELSFEGLVFAAGEAAIKAYEAGNYDEQTALLVTYARKSIRGAVRDEINRQIGQDENVPLDEEIQIPEYVPDAFGLEVSDLPSTCEFCNGPIPKDKPSDTRFCSDAHRKRYHYLRTQQAEDYAEAIEFRYATLPPLPKDASEDWVLERALLREAVNELHQRRRYWRRLEQWLLSIWESRVSSSTYNDLKDWRSRITDNRQHQTRELMRPSDHDHHRRRP